jgi:N-acetylglucosaminyldiphosphoundecaprenol N-acetyl-beta-D-mannosaminyltransferase
MNSKLILKGFKINDSNLTVAVKEVETLISSKRKSYVCFCEANLLKSALYSKRVTNILAESSLVFPDGKVIQLLAKVHHNKNIERVTGPDFMLTACKYGQAKKWRHFFYGGAEGVADKLTEKLQKKYPDMIVAGTYSPPFTPLTKEQDKDISKMIEAKKPDLLWVGLGGPKQEIWMNEHLNKIDVPVMLGVGAAFDFHSGNRPWAPKWVKKCGMEWLFRALSGGRKTFLRNIKCVTITGSVLIIDYFKYRILDLRKP